MSVPSSMTRILSPLQKPVLIVFCVGSGELPSIAMRRALAVFSDWAR